LKINDGERIVVNDGMSPKTKFIFDKFPNNEKMSGKKGRHSKLRFRGNDIEEGEKIIQDFNCAVELKILV
jgi:hypothetical protein